MNWEQFRPTYLFACVEDVQVTWLLAQSKKYILLDVDNTLAVWNEEHISPEVDTWLQEVLRADIRVVLISNSGAARLRRLSTNYGINYISWAGKPLNRSFIRGLTILNCSDQNRAVVIGDQVFTDVWGGNRLGLTTVLLTPRYDKDYIWTKLMRHLEKFVLNKLQIRKKSRG